MIRDITLGQYYPGSSFIHKIDPRVKILSTFLYIIGLFFIETIIDYIWIVLFLGIVIAVSKVPIKFMIKGLRPLIIIILITFGINIFMTPGELMYSIGFLKVTREGLNQGLFMGIRLILLIIGSSVLTLTTKPIKLADGIEKLLNPFKKIGVPSHELAMMMTIALRFIPTLLEETDKIMKAQMARGADFESGNIFKRAKSLIPLLVPLFISAFRRADELAMAMEARCYNGGDNRTRMHEIKFEGKDLLSLVTVVFLVAVLIVKKYI